MALASNLQLTQLTTLFNPNPSLPFHYPNMRHISYHSGLKPNLIKFGTVLIIISPVIITSRSIVIRRKAGTFPSVLPKRSA
jgi:hypothetical protein